MSQPLILTIMRIPIRVLNFLICVVGGVFYAPSYIYFLLIKGIVFNQSYSKTKTLYATSWLPRLTLLSLGFYLFVIQFYYILRWYWQHDLDTDYRLKLLSLIVSTGGSLFLMRRGYIKSLKYLNIPQLKSPRQHINLFGVLLMDLPSVLLGIVNLLLLSHALQTFRYEYNPNKRNFLPHVTHLVGSSLLFNFQKPACLYLKVFPWRLKQSEDFKKQKQYTLQRSIILVFILFHTNLDLLLFVLIGWTPFLSPWGTFKRYIKLLKRCKCNQWRRIILTSTWVALSQYLQILLLILSFPINPLQVINIIGQTYKLKQFLNNNTVKQINLDNEYLIISLLVLIQSIISVLTFIARVVIFVSVYKQRKLRKYYQQTKEQNTKLSMLKQMNKKGIQEQQVFLKSRDYQASLKTEKYKFLFAVQFLIDIPFWVLAVANILLKPWEYRGLSKLIDESYNLKRLRIVQKIVHGVVLYLTILALVVIFPLYFHHLPQIISWYKNPSQRQLAMSKMKRLEGLAFRIIQFTFRDIKSLILWYSMFIFGASSTASDTQILRQEYQSLTLQFQIFYRKNVVNLFNKDLVKLYDVDKQYITDALMRLKFWRTAHAIKNLRVLIKFSKIPIILTYYLKSYYNRKIQSITQRHEQLNISCISRQLGIHKQVLDLTWKLNIRMAVQFFLFFVSLALISISLWRLPTLVHLIKSGKYTIFRRQGEPKSLTIFRTITYVSLQQLKDVLYLPIYILAFVLCPLRTLKFITKFSYKYPFANIKEFEELFDNKRRYFVDVIFLPSLSNMFYFSQMVFVHITFLRTRYLYQLLEKQKVTLNQFFRHIIGIEQLPPLNRYNDENENHALKIKSLINYAAIQTLRDIIFLPFYVFPFLFPYRIMHILYILKIDQVSKSTRYDQRFLSGRRQLIWRLNGRILRDDFICLILSLTLLFSVIRTRRGIFLITRNFRRNWTIKFLIYDYKKDLIQQNIALLKDIQAIMQFSLILLYIVRVKQTFRRIKQLHNQHIQLRKAQQQINQIKQTTKILNKRQRLGLIGIDNFKTICKFLEPNDINHISRTSKDIYLWCNQQDLWEDIWRQRYLNSVNTNKTFKEKCIDEYLKLKPAKPKPITYYTIASEQLLASTHKTFSFVECFNLEFMNMRWLGQNFFTNLGMDVRQDQTTIKFFIAAPVGLIISKTLPYFSNQNHRYFKQGVVIIVGVLIVSFVIASTLFLGSRIYQVTKYIGVYSLMLLWISSFVGFFVFKFEERTRGSTALHPFDLPDIIYKAVKQIVTTIYQKISRRVRQVYQYLKVKSIETKDYISAKAEIVGNYTKFAAKKVFDKVIVPMYKKIAKALRSLRDFIVSCWQQFKSLLSSIFNVIKNVITGFKNVLKLLGRGYLGVLTVMMSYFLKLGKIGDLIFTVLALVYFALPLVISYLFYWKSIAVIPSAILSVITVIKGYSTIKINYEKIKQE